ncbi:MAG TPA: hypothetical protein VMU99_06120 [Acidimicrobiales bacterium]|nr:hypothetical protein [Acidimicrobiales bacterium]
MTQTDWLSLTGVRGQFRGGGVSIGPIISGRRPLEMILTDSFGLEDEGMTIDCVAGNGPQGAL